MNEFMRKYSFGNEDLMHLTVFDGMPLSAFLWMPLCVGWDTQWARNHWTSGVNVWIRSAALTPNAVC